MNDRTTSERKEHNGSPEGTLFLTLRVYQTVPENRCYRGRQSSILVGTPFFPVIPPLSQDTGDEKNLIIGTKNLVKVQVSFCLTFYSSRVYRVGMCTYRKG